MNRWHYQTFFSPHFKLVKNEERPELNFLDSLKFKEKDKEEVFFLVTDDGNMSSLNIALSKLSNTHVSVYTFSFSYHFEFSYSSTCPLYMGNLIMSPTWQISLVVLSASQKLHWVIFVPCSLFKDLSLHLIIILIPSLSYLTITCVYLPLSSS